MKTQPIVPAQLAASPSPGGPPRSQQFDDVYHAEAGAWEQAQHVFLAGNGLPQRWQRRDRFVILEAGFGLGNNFLATWQAWRADPQRCARLCFISIEKHPLRQADLAAVLARQHGDCTQPGAALATQLVSAWPPLLPGLHSLSFEAGAVNLLLALGDVRDLLPQLMASVDAFYLDGFAPAKNPQMWDAHLLKRLNRLAASDATAATWSVARSVRDGLSSAGFAVDRAPGFAGKREMTVARYAPRHHASGPPGGLVQPPQPEPPSGRGRPERHALVIGAGLAGAAAAFGLAEQGWRSTVLERGSAFAQGASGNPGGLFHGVIHPDDGPHARAHRAAALATAALAGPWIAQGRVRGSCQGLLRLDAQITDAQATQLIERLGLPPDYARWLPRHTARAASGLDVPSGGWWFTQGGWLHPGDYVRALLDTARAEVRLGCHVHSLRRSGGCWQALDAQGQVLAEAPSVVLANALDAARLAPADPHDPHDPKRLPALLPLQASRGQVTWVSVQAAALAGLIDTPDGLRLPLAPVTGAGYVLSLPALPTESATGDLKADERVGSMREGLQMQHPLDAQLLCGATSHIGDWDPALRAQDHLSNLELAARLGALAAPAAFDHFDRRGSAPDFPAAHGWADPLADSLASSRTGSLGGRVGWRALTPDRLPLIGALPQLPPMAERAEAERAAAGAHVAAPIPSLRLDQPRLIPRLRDAHGGIFVLTGLGSRGITWAALAGRLLASWVTGSPVPVESDLRDALDVARFACRQARRGLHTP